MTPTRYLRRPVEKKVEACVKAEGAGGIFSPGVPARDGLECLRRLRGGCGQGIASICRCAARTEDSGGPADWRAGGPDAGPLGSPAALKKGGCRAGGS